MNLLFSLFLAADNLFEGPWKSIGAFLCRAMGRSSLTLAQTFLVLSMAIWVVADIYANPGSVPFSVFLAPLVLVVLHGLIKDTADEVQADSSILSMNYKFAVVVRVLYVCGAMASLFQMEWAQMASDLLAAAALYLATQNRPRRDSAFKKALGWLKAHRPQLRLPSPSPTPT